MNTAHKWKRPEGVVARPSLLFIYDAYSASQNHLHNDPNVALFFLEKDFSPGAKLKTQFNKSLVNAAFWPRQVANPIPFSSNKVQDIFNEFSIQPGSQEARIIQKTIKECEIQAAREEEKYCTISLASLFDLSTSNEVVSTEVDKETKLQECPVAPGVKKIAGDKGVACHKEDYPYAVFLCHRIENTRTVNVPLEGADGTRVKAMAVCHTDTSQRSPEHLSFQILKVKPEPPYGTSFLRITLCGFPSSSSMIED